MACLVIVLGVMYVVGLGQGFTFERLREYITIWQEFYHDNPIFFMATYFVFCICIATLPMPGVITAGLIGGVIMGFGPALIVVSFASAIGACFAMLLSRYLLRDVVQRVFYSMYNKVQIGFREDGFYYIFMLRLMPVPFFIVNIMLGLTHVSLGMFYIASYIGILPRLAIVIKTGAELGLMEGIQDIFSPSMMFLFALMGIFPLLSKRVIVFLTKKRAEELQL